MALKLCSFRKKMFRKCAYFQSQVITVHVQETAFKRNLEKFGIS